MSVQYLFYIFYKFYSFIFTISEAEFHVETLVVQVDFSEGRSIFAKIAEAIRGKEIGILGIFCLIFAIIIVAVNNGLRL